MLVLSRKAGERILIGDGIVVTLLQVQGRTVRIGIEAEGGIPIRRQELLERHCALNEQAFAPAPATTA